MYTHKFEKILKTASGEIYYEQISFSKDKPWLIMYPGMAIQASAYRKLALQLKDQYKSILINYRGIKPSRQTPLFFNSVCKVNHDTLKILQSLSIDKCSVLGESFGGMLALHFATQHPEMTEQVFVINSSLAGRCKFRLNPLALARIGYRSLFNWNLWKSISKELFSTEFQNKNPEKLRDWMSENTYRPFPVFAATSQLIAASIYYGKNLSQLKHHVHVIFGAKDNLVSPKNSLEIHKSLPNSTLVKFEHSGHHIAYEAADKLAELILKPLKNEKPS